MKAILLNSGIGKRMGSLTDSSPKALLSLSPDVTILDLQINTLKDNYVNDIIITTGPFADQIIQHVKINFPSMNIQYSYNPDYQTTNYIFSMHLIPNELIDDDVVLMHGDLVFPQELMSSVLSSSLENCVLVNKTVLQPEKDFKGRIENEQITEIGVEIFDMNCFALMPLYKLTKSFFLRWKKEIAYYINQGIDQVYAENAFNDIAHEIVLNPYYYTDQFCFEIDTPEDLSLAQSLFSEGG